MARLASRRLRRRLLLACSAAFLIAAIGFVALLGNTAENQPQPSNHPVRVDTPRQNLILRAADRAAIRGTAQLFVQSAVTRRQAERAYAIVSPSLRGDTTRADWVAGSIPVSPYPVGYARWTLAYSYADEVGYDVLVEPTSKELRPLVFRLTLVKKTPGGRWLVNAWTPLSSGVAGASDSVADYVPTRRVSPQPSAWWVLIPFAALALALAAPVVLAVSNRAKARRTRALFTKAHP